MNQDEYAALMEQTGAVLEVLEAKERWRVMQQWREVFAAPYHAATGKWKRGEYEWHVFSFEHTKHENAGRSIAAYAKQVAEKFYVVPEDEEYPAYFCVGGKLPNLRSLEDDIYVWSRDLTWTMAFTHEMEIGLGPYFCLREWVA